MEKVLLLVVIRRKGVLLICTMWTRSLCRESVTKLYQNTVEDNGRRVDLIFETSVPGVKYLLIRSSCTNSFCHRKVLL